ncbi:Acg family FMN-binding oxidoreductase [Vreelandella utahensis]|uniref:Acg family FMN-binding oxidoreductase n=1 Tax=Vreelandella halophila TaxID=86177 RepID=UPI001C4DEAC6|nr:Tat pathway signal protein [Halomonas utahensis]
MNYSQKVREIWEPPEPQTGTPDYRELVRYATLAASSHNTQPWLFKLEDGRIRILPDFSRRCPAVDPDDHHLYASLGCAAENLILAASAAGLKGYCSYDPSTSGVQIDFEETTPFQSSLFKAITERQCSRVEYDGSPLTAEQLQLLEQAGQGDGVSMTLLTDDEQKEQIARYVTKGNSAQFGDSAWARELKSWIRFSGREAATSGDGLYGPVMGSPSVPRWLGLLAMRFGFSAEKQNQKDDRHIRSSSAIAVLVSESDDKPHWIEAGRCYERLALQAAALELKTAFINQPVEVPELRGDFARFLGIGNRRPDLVLRIGRGPAAPRSLRRPVEEVLI